MHPDSKYLAPYAAALASARNATGAGKSKLAVKVDGVRIAGPSARISGLLSEFIDRESIIVHGQRKRTVE